MFSCLVSVPQSGDQAEMEEDQLQSDTQPPVKEEAREDDQASNEAQPQTSDPPEDQTETPTDVQERSDPASLLQSKPLWKPIPPLLPEPHRNGAAETRDQSCQTEERLQQTDAAGSNGHNTGG